ncbi:hypothetical protein L3X38_042242 [Prunus dulcis]|uniref:Uncharacterized protein n=1 Tax=Prunus dulcis TaxID=3755 RepID=A0AAD4UUT1_PRUDU|nr:hypothetical protein L3X38_042242 [Prunus dulcis]
MRLFAGPRILGLQPDPQSSALGPSALILQPSALSLQPWPLAFGILPLLFGSSPIYNDPPPRGPEESEGPDITKLIPKAPNHFFASIVWGRLWEAT